MRQSPLTSPVASAAHFPIILTVHPDGTAGRLPQFPPHFRRHHHPRLKQRSLSIQPDAAARGGGYTRQRRRFQFPPDANPDDDDAAARGSGDVISIQIIQATPNISPTCSLRSFSGDAESNGGGPSPSGNLLAFPPPAGSSLLKRPSGGSSPGSERRVSFSEDSIDNEESRDSPQPAGKPSAAVPFMNYLQVVTSDFLKC